MLPSLFSPRLIPISFFLSLSLGPSLPSFRVPSNLDDAGKVFDFRSFLGTSSERAKKELPPSPGAPRGLPVVVNDVAAAAAGRATLMRSTNLRPNLIYFRLRDLRYRIVAAYCANVASSPPEKKPSKFFDGAICKRRGKHKHLRQQDEE